MQIHHWQRDQAGELAECYNRQIQDVPYCYSQSSEAFSRGVEEELAELFGFRRSEALTSEKFIVAVESGSVVGFVDYGIHEQSEAESAKKVGVIRFLAYEPGCRIVGQALLEEAEQVVFTECGATEISVFPKGYIYHFCSPDGGFSTLAGHIAGLLGVNGYQVNGKTIYLSRTDLALTEPSCPDSNVRISVNGEKRRSRYPEIMINAELIKDGEETDVGDCLAYPLEYVQSSEEAYDQIYINWMGIARGFQGRGWGRYLLWKTFIEAESVGYTQCVLGTAETNSRALLFYSNYGFQVTHSSYSYAKNLNEKM
jgi:GNAT superfamily N-acetyltransferase